MFGDIFSMAENYGDRKVARYDDAEGSVMVSTAAVSDSSKPYETAIAHPKYNGGQIVIVELYTTKELAQVGHKKWLDMMLATPLPNELVDVSTAEIAKMVDSVAGKTDWRTNRKGGERS